MGFPELELLKGVYIVLLIFLVFYLYILILFFGRKKSNESRIFLHLLFLAMITILFYFYSYMAIYDKKRKMISLIQDSHKNLRTEYSKIDPKKNISKIEYLVPKNLSYIPVYYINLDTSTDRRKEMENELETYGVINYHRIPAVNGRDQEQLKNLISTAKNTTDVQLATTMSHMKAIYTAYKNGDDYAIILEDDMSFSTVPFWKKTILEIVENLPLDWTILNIGQINCQNGEMINHTEKNCYSACAYLINKKGMENIEKYISEKKDPQSRDYKGVSRGSSDDNFNNNFNDSLNGNLIYRITPGDSVDKFIAQGMPDNYLYEKSPGTWFYPRTLFYSRGNVSTIHKSEDLQNIVNTVRKLREFK
jgi:hypothetical protein